jgi:hypothetical protein
VHAADNSAELLASGPEGASEKLPKVSLIGQISGLELYGVPRSWLAVLGRQIHSAAGRVRSPE